MSLQSLAINRKQEIRWKQRGVPVIPGSKEPVCERAYRTVCWHEEIGYPVMIKAALGGGGKGMRDGIFRRRIHAKLSDRTEGKPDGISAMIPCILNILWSEPRHIEFQILADSYGNVVHLGRT